MKIIEKIKKAEWITGFSRATERKIFFIMTIVMLLWGILYKTGVIQG